MPIVFVFAIAMHWMKPTRFNDPKKNSVSWTFWRVKGYPLSECSGSFTKRTSETDLIFYHFESTESSY